MSGFVLPVLISVAAVGVLTILKFLATGEPPLKDKVYLQGAAFYVAIIFIFSAMFFLLPKCFFG